MPHILVVDDESMVREFIRLTLEGAGHQVMEAENGKVATALLRDHEFDLVITDIMMPEKEGIETMREIRGRSPRTRIVAMSGGGRINGSDYLSLARKLGADEVLSKPFRTLDLLELVDHLLV